MIPSMRAVVTGVVAGASIWLLGPAYLGGEQPSDPDQPTSATVRTELVQLNRTMSRILEVLERQTANQRLDLLLKRVELESDRIADLEDRLRRLESTQGSLGDERFRIQSRLETLGDQLEAAPPDLSRETLLSLEQDVTQGERVLERLEDQIAETEGRTAEVENELARRRADLRSLRAELDRALQGGRSAGALP